LGHDDLKCDHGDNEGDEASNVQFVGCLFFSSAFGGTVYHQETDDGCRDRSEEDVAPAQILLD